MRIIEKMRINRKKFLKMSVETLFSFKFPLSKIHLVNSSCFHVLKKAFSDNERFLLRLTVYPYFSLSFFLLNQKIN